MSVLSSRGLWIIVAVVAVLDILTTIYGLQAGLVESNPIARSAIDSWGVFGMIALKVGAIAIALATRQFVIRPYRPIVPATLALPWAAAVLVNIYMLSMVI